MVSKRYLLNRITDEEREIHVLCHRGQLSSSQTFAYLSV